MLLTSCDHLGVVAALAQRLGEQAHRVQRLAQVVAGGGEELRLRAVGGLGRAPRRVGDTAFSTRSCPASSSARGFSSITLAERVR